MRNSDKIAHELRILPLSGVCCASNDHRMQPLVAKTPVTVTRAVPIAMPMAAPEVCAPALSGLGISLMLSRL